MQSPIEPEVKSASVTHNYRYLLPLIMAAALGGFLFGYDTAVISGAVGYLQKHFQLSAGWTGWAASSALIGCIVGAMMAGVLGDALGRKKVLLLSALLFAVSAVGSALPRTLTEFVWARFLGGWAIGATSMLSPLYIAEVSPEKIRGRLVSLYQLAIVIGILAVFFVNLLIQRQGNEDWNTALGWRWMMGSLTFPALLFGGLLLPIPESPRWLMKMGRREQARDVLVRIGGEPQAQREMAQIEASLRVEEGTVFELFQPGYRKALVIGILLAVFSQFSGINAIMYYAPEIFKATGEATEAAFRSTVWIGAINLAFTFVAIWLVDRAGRRALLLVGTFMQFVALTGVGYLFWRGSSGVVLLLFILLFVASFACAMGPIPWIIMSEIYPTKIRGRAMSLGVLSLWTACYVVSQTFPMLKDGIGPAATFWCYATVSLASMLFVLMFVPETSGKTLEEIEASWRKTE